MATCRSAHGAAGCRRAAGASGTGPAGDRALRRHRRRHELARPQDWLQDRSVIDRLKFKNGWLAGLNTGFAFSNGLRPELELDHRRNAFSYDAFGTTTGSSNADSALLNLWYDVRSDSGPFSYLHPYVGAGAGGVRSYYRDAGINGVPISGADATQFAYQVGAGLAYDVSPHVTLSLDYRRLWTNNSHFHDDPAAYCPCSTRTSTGTWQIPRCWVSAIPSARPRRPPRRRNRRPHRRRRPRHHPHRRHRRWLKPRHRAIHRLDFRSMSTATSSIKRSSCAPLISNSARRA